MHVISIYANYSASSLHFSLPNRLKAKGIHYGSSNTGSRSSCIDEDRAYMKLTIRGRVLDCVEKTNLPD